MLCCSKAQRLDLQQQHTYSHNTHAAPLCPCWVVSAAVLLTPLWPLLLLHCCAAGMLTGQESCGQPSRPTHHTYPWQHRQPYGSSGNSNNSDSRNSRSSSTCFKASISMHGAAALPRWQLQLQPLCFDGTGSLFWAHPAEQSLLLLGPKSCPCTCVATVLPAIGPRQGRRGFEGERVRPTNQIQM